MENNEYLNKWVSSDIIYWKDKFQERDNLQYIEERDQEFAKNNVGYVFGKCVGIFREYLIIYNAKYDLRILPEFVRNIYPAPDFEWGMEVQEIERPEIKGVIDDLFWHQNRQEFLYYLKVNNKRKTRQYQSKELSAIPALSGISPR